MVQHLTQIHTILSLVHFAWGIAVVPESASKMHFDNVVCRPLTLARPAQVELDLVWRINNENPVLNRLMPALHLDKPRTTGSTQLVDDRREHHTKTANFRDQFA